MYILNKNKLTESYLNRKLLANNIQPEQWVGKSVNGLLNEVLQDECYLGIHKELRLTRVLNIGICQIKHPFENLWLRETSRVINNGFLIRSNLPMSGKLRYSKNILNEMLRELKEELTLPEWAIYELPIVSEFSDSQTEIKTNNGYIGLPTIYNRHIFSLTLPEQFVKDKYVEVDGNKICTFEWGENIPNLK